MLSFKVDNIIFVFILEDEEPVKFVPNNLAEAEFATKVSLFVPKDDDLEVLVHHAVAE